MVYKFESLTKSTISCTKKEKLHRGKRLVLCSTIIGIILTTYFVFIWTPLLYSYWQNTSVNRHQLVCVNMWMNCVQFGNIRANSLIDMYVANISLGVWTKMLKIGLKYIEKNPPVVFHFNVSCRKQFVSFLMMFLKNLLVLTLREIIWKDSVQIENIWSRFIINTYVANISLSV